MSLRVVFGPRIREILLMANAPRPVFFNVTLAVAKLYWRTIPKSMLDGVNVTIGPLVLACATISVKVCVALLPVPLLATRLIGKVPAVAGVPPSVAVPL